MTTGFTIVPFHFAFPVLRSPFSPMPQLVVATRNRKKLGEIVELLAPYGVEVRCVADFPDVPETVEDGSMVSTMACSVLPAGA